jgi:hypothetical protein
LPAAFCLSVWPAEELPPPYAPGFFAFAASLGPFAAVLPDELPPPFDFAWSLLPDELEPSFTVLPEVPTVVAGAVVCPLTGFAGVEVVGAVTVGSVASVVVDESPEEPQPAATSAAATATTAAAAYHFGVDRDLRLIRPARMMDGAGPYDPPRPSVNLQ